MKLDHKIKQQIDNYFASVTPEHLFEIAVTKYKFIDIGIEFSGFFTSVNTKHITDDQPENFNLTENNDSSYTKAA